jgi:hypothetical protein
MKYASSDETGRILFFRECDSEQLQHYRLQGETLTVAEDDVQQESYCVVDGVVVKRDSMPLSISGTTISGIPAGSVLAIGEQTFEVDDGEAEIDGYSGTVKITCWPYLDAEVTL